MSVLLLVKIGVGKTCMLARMRILLNGYRENIIINLLSASCKSNIIRQQRLGTQAFLWTVSFATHIDIHTHKNKIKW